MGSPEWLALLQEDARQWFRQNSIDPEMRSWREHPALFERDPQ